MDRTRYHRLHPLTRRAARSLLETTSDPHAWWEGPSEPPSSLLPIALARRAPARLPGQLLRRVLFALAIGLAAAIVFGGHHP